MGDQKTRLLQGTLDLMILRVVALEPLHGYGIGLRIGQVTRGAFSVNAGSLFPALYRLERQGYLLAEWGESENNRRAKYYSLTADGRRLLAEEEHHWRRVSLAMTRLLEST